MMNDTYGHMYATPLAHYDPNTQSWRTSPDTSLWDLPTSSPTLPQSGTMRNGELFERPMLAPLTNAKGYLSLPTQTTDAGRQSGECRDFGADMLHAVTCRKCKIQTLPTPHAGLGERGRDGVYPNPKGQQDLQHTLATLLPTPTASRIDAETEESWLAKTEQLLADDQGVKTVSLGLAVRSMKTKSELTTTAHQSTIIDSELFDDETVKSYSESEMNWGKYAAAIKRWENLTRPVPEPTIPHKDKRRLNPKFVEWMMGLDDGHVTGHGLSIAQELKMLGNGVVPQQARAAITQLLERTQQ